MATVAPMPRRAGLPGALYPQLPAEFDNRIAQNKLDVACLGRALG
jgi:hypothetical protein